MAVLLDTSAKALYRTTNLPSATAFTICGWFTQRGTQGSSNLLAALLNVGPTAYNLIGYSGSNIVITTAAGSTTVAAAPASGTPFFWALTCSGTGAGSLIGYYALRDALSLTSASQAGTTFTPSEMDFSNTVFGYYLNGDIGPIYCYDAVLTADQLLAQSKIIRPLFSSNLNSWFPMMRLSLADNVLDYSGNGRSLSSSGSPSVADNPPISWGASAMLYPFASAALQQTIGQATETNTAQALSRRKSKAIGQANETDLAQAMRAARTYAIAQALETEIAQAFARLKSKAIGQALETDVAQALARLKSKVIGQASEGDLAQAMRAARAYAIAQALETDVAQALARLKSKVIGQASETDLAQTFSTSAGMLIGQASETDLAQALFRTKRVVVTQVFEDDIAQAFIGKKERSIAQVLESDTAQAFLFLKRRAIAQVNEVDLAQAFLFVKQKAISQVNEVDLAQAFVVLGVIRYGAKIVGRKRKQLDGIETRQVRGKKTRNL